MLSFQFNTWSQFSWQIRGSITFLTTPPFPRNVNKTVPILAFLWATCWLQRGKPCSVEGLLHASEQRKLLSLLPGLGDIRNTHSPCLHTGWEFLVNPSPHAAFQKPRLEFRMKINTILLTAQNLIAYKCVLQEQDNATITSGMSKEKDEGRGLEVHSTVQLTNQILAGLVWHHKVATVLSRLLPETKTLRCQTSAHRPAPSGSGSFTSSLARGENLHRWNYQWCFKAMPWSPHSMYSM